MNSPAKLIRISKHLTLVLVLVLATIALNGGKAGAQTGTMPPLGLVCTTSATATFNLTTQTGYIQEPDGNVIFMWGFSEGSTPFQHPGPVLCVNEGDTVTVNLTNTLAEDVSIIFPGQENVLANGVLAQPVFSGTDLVSLAPVAAANGGTVTYTFAATRPGTFIYESGTEPAKQVNLGLFGALVVRPAMNVYDAQGNLVEAYAYNDPDTRYNPATEYILIMSDIDPELHMAVEQGFLYNMNRYRARYWLYNGRSFPDTIMSNGADFVPNQPYGALIYLHPYDPVTNPYPTLIRQLNVGSMDYPHHPHGNHGRLIAFDGHLLKSGADDTSFEKFTVTIHPGQTIDSLFGWKDTEGWNPTTNPIPVTIPQLQDLTTGNLYSGSPYLGSLEGLPVGTQGLNQCGEYYHIAHSHALHQITSWGMVTSGHITFARIDPPLPNECP